MQYLEIGLYDRKKVSDSTCEEFARAVKIQIKVAAEACWLPDKIQSTSGQSTETREIDAPESSRAMCSGSWIPCVALFKCQVNQTTLMCRADGKAKLMRGTNKCPIAAIATNAQLQR